MNHIILLILLMISLGILGGIVNYLYGDSKGTRKVLKYINYDLLKSVFTGIAASFLVPLFLNMMSSNIMQESETNPLSLFIFCGFCIIASVSSKAFIKTLSSRILEKVNRVQEDMAAVKDQLDPVIMNQTEFDEEPNGNGGEREGGGGEIKKPYQGELDALKTLKGLSCSSYTFRSINGLARETGIDAGNVKTILEDYVANGMAGKVIREQNIRFYITEKGRKQLSNLIPYDE